MKTYLYDQFPEGMLAVDFLESIIAAGIDDAQLALLTEGNRLVFGWQNFEYIGDFETEISPAVS